MSTNPLVAFAILSVNWDEHGKSYTHNYIPFIASCLERSTNESTDEDQLRSSIESDFGITLPSPVLRTILRRAAKDGLVERKNRQIIPNVDKLTAYDFESKRTQVTSDCETLIDRFIQFLDDDNNDLAITRPEAERILFDYIADRSLPILRASVHRSPLDLEELPQTRYAYPTARFIIDMHENDPHVFEQIDRIVKGSILASAVYLPDFESLNRRIQDLIIYLDTPYLIELIGLTQPPAVEAARELFELLKTLGARLACFEHTLLETQGVIRSSASQLRSLLSRPNHSSSYTPLVEHCIAARVPSSDLDVRAELLPDELADLGVRVHETPEYTEAFSVDEERMQSVLQASVRYRNENTRYRDVQSLTAVHRIRRGRKKRRLEEAAAIFVTPNDNLVHASREFFNESPQGDLVPICALDSELATVAWLKKPAVAPNLPRKQLIADCYAASYPSDDLWTKYLDEIDRLESQDSFSDEMYYALRYSVEARRLLMDITSGETGTVNPQTIGRVLDGVKRTLTAEVTVQLKTEIQLRENTEEELERVRAQFASQEDPEQVAGKAFAQLCRRQSDSVGRLVVRGLSWMLFALIVAGTLTSALLKSSDLLAVILSSVVGGGFSLLAAWNLLHGTRRTSFASTLEHRISDWSYARLMRSHRKSPS